MINLEERINRIENLLRKVSSNIKSDIRVALPATILSFDPDKQTVVCKPLIRELVNTNGTARYEELPELRDVPISIPRAGNWAITLPIKPGDECMVIFQDLCIDGWWFRGGIQNWNDLRRHDLSDAIAIFSPWSQPNIIPSYNTNNLEVRNLDNTVKISMGSNGVTMRFPQGCNIEGDITVNGDVTSTGTVAGQVDVIAGGISGKSHIHPGVTTGGGSTGAPQ